jgi:hypothetical protein
LTLGNEHAVALVAMATPEDMRVDAEHIRMADQARARALWFPPVGMHRR